MDATDITSFYRINAGGAENGRGVRVQIRHHDYLEYSDNGRITYVGLGIRPGSREILVYMSEVSSWIEGDQQVAMSAAEKLRVEADLRSAILQLDGVFNCV